MRRLLAAAVTACLLLSASGAGAALNYIEDVDRLDQVKEMPAFTATTLDGAVIDSREMVGRRVILMAFWSIYCEACVRKFGGLVKIRHKYSPDLLDVISVSTDVEYRMPAESIRSFIRGLEVREKYQVNFPVIFEGGAELARKLGIAFLPAIIAVDRTGRIVGTYRRFTEDSEEEIIRGIETIIPEDAREPPP